MQTVLDRLTSYGEVSSARVMELTPFSDFRDTQGIQAIVVFRDNYHGIIT